MATNDLSQLTSLEALTKSAEARTPIPAPAQLVTSGSGLIDIMEIDRKSRESSKPPAVTTPSPIASASLGVPPPLPSSQAALVSISDSDVYTTMASSRRKRRAIGAIGGAVAILGITAAVILSWSGPKPAPAPIAEVQAPVTQAVTAPAPPPAPVETSTPAVAPAPPPQPAAAATTAVGKGHGKGRKGPARSGTKGPKLTKVTSSGTH